MIIRTRTIGVVTFYTAHVFTKLISVTNANTAAVETLLTIAAVGRHLTNATLHFFALAFVTVSTPD